MQTTRQENSMLEGDVFLTVRIPRDLRDRLNEIAKREDRTQAAEVRRAIVAHVKTQAKK